MTSATRRRVGRTVVAIALLPVAVRAQSISNTTLPVGTFAEIASRGNLKTGTTLIVTEPSGRSVKGKLTAITADAVSLRINDRTLTFTDRQVRELRQRLTDSKIEGALIGFAVGWLVPAIVCTSRSDSSETVGCQLDTLLLGGLPGLAIGAAIDAARSKTVIIFRAMPSAQVMVAPIMTSRRYGVRASIQFGR